MKNSVKNKKLFFIFVDLEKAFDRVTREIIRFALRRKGFQNIWQMVSCLFRKVVKLLS